MSALRVGIVSPTATYWTLYLAARENANLELVSLGSTSGAARALASGEVDVAGFCPEAVVRDVDTGGVLRIGAGLADRPPAAIVARADVDGLAALRGRRVAVTEPRGGVSLFLRAALRRAGLTPDEYRQVVIGATPAQAAALERGDVAAAMLTSPYDRRFKRLASMADLLGACAFATLNVRAGFTADPRWSILLEALAVAERRMREDRAEAVAMLAEWTGVGFDDASACYDARVEEQRVSPESIHRLIDLMREDGLAALGPAARYTEAAVTVSRDANSGASAR